MYVQRSIYLLQKSVSSSINPVRWQRGIKDNINPSQILPAELGGSDQNIHRAWLGDKILGAHVAKYTSNLFKDSLDRGVASSIASVALSNRFLRENISTILPGYYETHEWTDKTAGTVVEAAVSLMSDKETDDLAQYLVKKAINENILSSKRS